MLSLLDFSKRDLAPMSITPKIALNPRSNIEIGNTLVNNTTSALSEKKKCPTIFRTLKKVNVILLQITKIEKLF